MYESFELGEPECEDLLRAGVVGRVAACTPTGPHVVPVNYAVIDDAVVFRTTPYSVLGSQPLRSIIALETDHFDYEHQRGWSVVARGRAEMVVNAAELASIRSAWDPGTWASGTRVLYVRMSWSELTGRRLGSGWDPMATVPVRRAV
jgi:nitroimidazol reductase NimA-like FMN-containing flavoprotein (pyridoxamine 5'-phosphate oxidase superfamily)